MKEIRFEILDPYCLKLHFDSNLLAYPLNVYFTTHGTGEIFWQTEIPTYNMWCAGPPQKGLDVKVVDSNGDIVFMYDWSFGEHSDIVERKFIEWCRSFIVKNGKKPKGIAIGTCDGSNGEWVEAHDQGLIGECLLIEPNTKPFLSLVSKYQNDCRFRFKQCAIGENDGLVDFFTDDSGTAEFSSLIESNYLKHKNSYKKITVKSINPNNLFSYNNPDWLHIDAEGYDGKILMLMTDDSLFSIQFLIWEHIHIDEETNISIKERLNSLGFEVVVGQEYNTCAYRY